MKDGYFARRPVLGCQNPDDQQMAESLGCFYISLLPSDEAESQSTDAKLGQLGRGRPPEEKTHRTLHSDP